MKINLVLDNDEFLKLENLRYEVLGLPKEIMGKSYYLDKFNKYKLLGAGAYIDNKLVGGIYISDSYDTLYIEYLFVSKEYQSNKNHIGSELLSFVLKNKNAFEEYFNIDIYVSMLEPGSELLRMYYRKFGYKDIGNNYMKRTI